MIQAKPNLYWLFTFVLVLTIGNLVANTHLFVQKKDTVIAQVVYGDNTLIPGIESMTINEINQYYDSLSNSTNPPTELLTQLHLYMKIQTMNFDETYGVIDSLFDLKEIPYPLINALNNYIANNSNHQFELEQERIDTSDYPADFFYHDWNTITPNPYNSNKLTIQDTLVELQLINTKRSKAFVMPVNNVLTSEFGWRDGRPHKGIDIDVQVWDTVVTAFSGMVRVARTYGGYGRVVVVRHFNGLETLYAHLHRIKVVPGQIVNAGDLIGLGGSSGHSTGSHLHWEIRFKGVPINPLKFIDYKAQKLMTNTLILHKTKFGFAAYPKGSVFYSVKRGDYLYKIADQYGTTVTSICKLNGISRNSTLYVGQKIRVI